MVGHKFRIALERWGRDLLARWLAAVAPVPQRPVGQPTKVLVVRIDERIGNLVLTTPLLASLRARFPSARLDLLANHRGAALLADQVDRFHAFDKRRPLRALLLVGSLRRAGYDLCIDAGNPTDPSLTQAFIVGLVTTRDSVGSAVGPYCDLYSAPVTIAPAHELVMRLSLLDALPGRARVSAMRLTAPSLPPGSPAAVFQARLGERYLVLNVGARHASKQLGVDVYRRIAEAMASYWKVAVVYGPNDQDLALGCGQPLTAPPTTLSELCALLSAARAVVTCDTGPMHMSVALGVPTLGLFVSTDSARYGHTAPPHLAVHADHWAEALPQWLQALPPPPCAAR
jgi:ADP-heptose:LPS heptosyltransferase